MESIVLGGGCFWCLDASYRLIQGVNDVVSGFSGGSEEDADYYRVVNGDTGHAEVVKVSFDPQIISLDDILDVFWVVHDPTTLNRQAYDVGPQYRSVIFYADEAQRHVATASIAKAQLLWDDPIVTELAPLRGFYPAEEYHQNYFENHPEQAYCQIIINPKLHKLREKFATKIRPESV